MKIDADDTLVMIGDSITDCGREYPIGEKDGLGNGYVSQVWALLNAVYPESKVKVVSTGINGHRVTDLAERWQTDVIDLNPDWVSVMIGINDVWRNFDADNHMDQVDLSRYEEILGALVGMTRGLVKGMVVMSPFFLETNTADPMRSAVDEYSAASKRVAAKHDVLFADVQAAFDRFLEAQPTQFLSIDRVHVNTVGHMIIARSFLDAVGFQWDCLNRLPPRS
jgi:lysophospholipase L1-like esterase